MIRYTDNDLIILAAKPDIIPGRLTFREADVVNKSNISFSYVLLTNSLWKSKIAARNERQKAFKIIQLHSCTCSFRSFIGPIINVIITKLFISILGNNGFLVSQTNNPHSE